MTDVIAVMVGASEWVQILYLTVVVSDHVYRGGDFTSPIVSNGN